MRLKIKLSLFNLLSKLLFTAIFLILLPFVIERINLRQVDNDLIHNRENVISLISEIGIEPFITSDSSVAFGSYNILKEEFISIEKIESDEELNYIEVTSRIIEGEEINYRVLNYTFKIEDQNYLLEVGKSLTIISNAARNTRKIMLLFLIFIVLITFITDIQYNKLLLRPLDIITNKLKGISDPSIFDKRPVRTTTSDFYSLDNALTGLIENINESFRKEKDITVNISHELLTPVSVLRSKLENLLLREDIDPEITTKIEESLKTLHRLQSMVNSLLLIARIESHQYLREDSVSIKGLLQEIISEIKPIAEDAGIILKDELKEDFQFMKANRSLLFSMLYNILNNSVKHISSDGSVIISSAFHEKRFKISITDSGQGLTDEQMNNLFSRFKMRNPNSGEGTGIGLAIAKSIADFHKIDISVSSKFNEGTIFSFLFP